MRFADGHCDTFLELFRKKGKIKEESELHITLEGLRKGRIGLFFASAFIESRYKPDKAVERTCQLLEYMLQDISTCEDLEIIKSKDDLSRLESQIGVVIAIEGGEALGNSLELVSFYHRLGVRSIGLTWNQENNLACGVAVKNDSGLTSFGRRVVKEMEGLGMVVDGAHLGKKSLKDLFQVATKPLAITHANVKNLCDHPRNLSDSEIKSIGDLNGVLGITYVPEFIDSLKERQNIDRVVDHIEYVAYLIGVSHVALGSDFDGIETTPKGLEHIGCVPMIQTLLEKRGFSPIEIEQIMFRNWFRLLEEILI